jgi:hypothetical protein
VGERALALCGKEFKVKVTWDDVPKDKPICRDCVDMALLAMTDADELIGKVRRAMILLTGTVEQMTGALTPDDFALDVIAEFTEDFRTERERKREAKELEQRAKSTCTCTWTDMENFVEDPGCPIHGQRSASEPEDPPVAPPE